MAIAPFFPPGVLDETEEDEFYPSGDGKPMAESDLHAAQMMYCIQALQGHYVEYPHVYVAGNNFLYYEEGRRDRVVSPDCYVVFGVAKHPRDSYKVWQEAGHVPSVVIEITSKSTKREDEGNKRQKYALLGVAEYYQFDPAGDYVRPRLKGSKLVNGQYESMPLVNNRLHSPALKLDLVVLGNTLRYYDPNSQTWLPTYEDQNEQLEMETRARMEAETKVVQLLAELEALRQKP